MNLHNNPFKNTEELINKGNRYSTLGVVKLQIQGKIGSVIVAFFHGFWSFIKHYIFKLGFLDGGPGFVIEDEHGVACKPWCTPAESLLQKERSKVLWMALATEVLDDLILHRV